MINPYWELILLLTLINVIFALSLNLILGFNGQFALGHAGFLAVGAYTSGVLTSVLHWPLFGAVLCSIGLTVVFATIIGYPCLRLRGDYLAIATLGFAEIIRIVLIALPKDVFGGPTGMQRVDKLSKFVALPESMNGIGNFAATCVFALLAAALLVWGTRVLVGNIERALRGRLGPAVTRWLQFAAFSALAACFLWSSYSAASQLMALYLKLAPFARFTLTTLATLLAASGALCLIKCYELALDRRLFAGGMRFPGVMLPLGLLMTLPPGRKFAGEIFLLGDSFKRKSFDSEQWVLFAIYGALVALVLWLIRNYLASSAGRAVVAIREDEIAAQNLGIDIAWMKLQNFMFACGFAGLAGALLAHTVPLFRPQDFGFFKSVDVLLMVVLGGMGSLTGSVLGAVCVTFLPEVLRFLGQWRLVIYSLLLILLMLFRPGGLFGAHELSDVIKLRWPPRKRLPAAAEGGSA